MTESWLTSYTITEASTTSQQIKSALCPVIHTGLLLIKETDGVDLMLFATILWPRRQHTGRTCDLTATLAAGTFQEYVELLPIEKSDRWILLVVPSTAT